MQAEKPPPGVFVLHCRAKCGKLKRIQSFHPFKEIKEECPMIKRTIAFALALLLAVTAFAACGKQPPRETTAPTEPSQTTLPTETEPPATTPPDGNPEDVTCKGTYYDGGSAAAVAAAAGEAELTNEALQVWYWAAVGEYVQSGREPQPDLSRGLDAQVCPVDDSVNSWQQYFLRQALNAWHTAQALSAASETWQQPLEEAYKPIEKTHQEYLGDVPATRWLYGYNTAYTVNTMHQKFLDELPELFETLAREKGYESAEAMAQTAFGVSAETLRSQVERYNRGYMFFVEETYYLDAPTDEEIEAEAAGLTGGTEPCVSIRHVLLRPEGATIDAQGVVTASEEAWEACLKDAQTRLDKWKRTYPAGEPTFANLAHDNSLDAGNALDGGGYQDLVPGQLPQELEAWCFDETRKNQDVTVLRSPYGVHMLFFVSGRTQAEAQAEQLLRQRQERALIDSALEALPMEVHYGDITLREAEGTVSLGELLYSDIGHECFPEIPLYLQQDYPSTMYGNYRIMTHGCGITSMAMLASYMGDDLYTPPKMCSWFGTYCSEHGTEGALFIREPPRMNFYVQKWTSDPNEVLEALKEGKVAVSIQRKGYWTRGGHFIVLEKLLEDGTVQVRDSNIYNYKRIAAHAQDRHAWKDVTAASKGYWIFDHKIDTIPACARCGEAESLSPKVVSGDYLCRKCRPAALRRGIYMDAIGE